jgi:benzylsuccinate CoA-transferase BbsF subunit
MARLKLDYASLSQVNPRIVFASMAGYGQDGPRRDWVSMNVNLQGYVGIMMVTGAADDPPIAVGNSWCDYIGGLTTCFAIVQALIDRDATGVGANLDVAQFEANVGPLGSLLTGSILGAGLPPRLENRSPYSAPQGVYPCGGEDDWCAVSVRNDLQWAALVRLLGSPSELRDPSLATVLGRQAAHDRIDRTVEAWTRTLPAGKVEDALKAVGVPAERVRKIEQVVDEPSGPSVFHRVPDPRVDEIMVTGLPFSMAAGGMPGPFPAAVLGQHTDEVLREWLGLEDGDIAALKEEVLV